MEDNKQTNSTSSAIAVRDKHIATSPQRNVAYTAGLIEPPTKITPIKKMHHQKKPQMRIVILIATVPRNKSLC